MLFFCHRGKPVLREPRGLLHEWCMCDYAGSNHTGLGVTGKFASLDDFVTNASLFFLSLAVTPLFVNSYSTITCYLYSEPMKPRMQGEQFCGFMKTIHCPFVTAPSLLRLWRFPLPGFPWRNATLKSSSGDRDSQGSGDWVTVNVCDVPFQVLPLFSWTGKIFSWLS